MYNINLDWTSVKCYLYITISYLVNEISVLSVHMCSNVKYIMLFLITHCNDFYTIVIKELAYIGECEWMLTNQCINMPQSPN